MLWGILVTLAPGIVGGLIGTVVALGIDSMIRQAKERRYTVGVCTRPPHTASPCNGWPRPDCPGFR